MHSNCSVPSCSSPSRRKRGWCNAHYQRWLKHGSVYALKRPQKKSDADMAFWFWKRVRETETCWIWEGYTTKEGYGTYQGFNKRIILAHRFAYQQRFGTIPKGLQIDHLCQNPSCVNPKHLEAVTPRENTMRSRSITAVHARKTHCIHSHPFDEANTYRTPQGSRVCRACRNTRSRKRGWAVRAH